VGVGAAFLDRDLLEEWNPASASHRACDLVVPDPPEESNDRVLAHKLEP